MSIERIKLFMVRNYRYKTKPYEHQYVALEKSWDKEEFAYFMEMGTGKSKVLIDNIAMLYDKGKINAAMIIAPKGVYRNWLSLEIPTHLSSHIQYKSVLWTASTSKTKDKEYQSLFETDYDLHIFIMNVEALSTSKGLTFARKFLSCHNALIAVDESTTIKTPRAARTKNIISIASYAKYKRILTGSPVTKSPLDLYTQCKFLNENLLGFSSYYSFQNRYACMVDRWFGGRKVSVVKSYQRLDELSELITPFSYRVLKEDCLDLPDKIYIKREVELTEEQLKMYQSMKIVAMAALKGKVVKAPHVLTQLMRLHQITCGHVMTETGEIVDIENNRLKELINILEEVESKVIIWSHYTHDIRKISAELRKIYGEDSVVEYYGGTESETRQSNLEKFQDPRSPVRFFVGNPQTGGYGITLTAASTVIYYSNGYDLEKRLQSEDRAHRIGQKKSVTYIDLIAEKTVDEKIVKALRKKINIASEVLGEDLKEWI
jgi:SNF2 family DNA or RNA helicase